MHFDKKNDSRPLRIKRGTMKTLAWKEIGTQIIASAGVTVLLMQTGIIEGWISPNLARLTDANATIVLTLSDASWLASCLTLGRIVTVILVPFFIELVGSKNSILCAFVPVSISWLLTMTAQSSMSLYIARFLCGVTNCLTFSCYPLYLGEISTPTFRGTCLAIASIGWPLGTLVGSVAETYLPEVASTSIYLVPSILGIVLFRWLPDSPYRLVKNGQMDEALEALTWYRGSAGNVAAEMKEIIEFVESTGTVNLRERIRQLKVPSVRNALLLVLLITILPQICGELNIFYYMQIILIDGKSNLVEPSQITIYTNVILLAFSVFTINLLDKFGRRIVLLASCAIMAVALLGLGTHFYLLDKVDPEKLQALPIVSMTTLLMAFALGLSPVMNVLLGELFPAGVKGTVATIDSLSAALSGFASTKSYQMLIDKMGAAYVYWMYAGIMAAAIPVFAIFLPETKGKSLQEIQMFLNRK